MLAAGDNQALDNIVTGNTVFGHVAPDHGLNFPATLTHWVALGKKSVLENPMTRPSGVLAFDGKGRDSGTMQASPLTLSAMEVNASMHAPAEGWKRTPFNNPCDQGMGFSDGLQDSHEVRACC